MRLLTDLDYLSVIQQTDLDQILEGVEQYRLDKEQVAQNEMKSYLIQRYEVDQIFTNTSVWSASIAYKGNALVYVTAAPYSAVTVYSPNQLMLFTDGKVYSCVTLTAAGENPNNTPAKWASIGVNKTMYFVTLPHARFDYKVSYVKDDRVWYNDRVYKAKQPNTNILPTNSGYWLDEGAYTVTAGTLPTDATKWTAGDNRNPLVVQYLIEITLFYLYKRINPRFIPDLRKEGYDGNGPTQSGGAIGWLKKVASGTINADLPVKSLAQGNTIRWGNSDGSVTRASNQY